MNFTIVNMTGFRNKGCEAITKVVIAETAKLFSDARFYVFSDDPAYDSLWAPSLQKVRFFPTPERAQSSVIKIYGIIREATIKKKSLTNMRYAPFHWANGIISIGGDIFSSDYGAVEHHLSPIRYATSLRKPVFLLAHSIGPFKTEKEREIFINSMQGVSLITTRETASLMYIQKMGLKNTHCELTADPAFLLPVPTYETIDRLCRAYHLPPDRPIIGISASQGIVEYAKTSYESHLEALKDLIQHLTSKFRFHIILIPHVQGKYIIDDRLICNRIYRSLGFPEDVTVINLDHSAEEIKGLIGRCEFLVAERMHAAIAGFSQSVPTLVVGYSLKAREIVKDIFSAEEMEKIVIPISKVSREVLIEYVEQLLSHRDIYAQHLARIIPTIQYRARRNFSLLQEILVGKNR